MRKLESASMMFKVVAPVKIGGQQLRPGEFITIRLHKGENKENADLLENHEIYKVQFGGALKIADDSILKFAKSLEKVMPEKTAAPV